MKLSISEFAKKTGESLNDASRGIKLALFSDIIQNTRFETGRLKGNWQTSTGSPVTSVIERDDNESGSAAISEAVSNVTPDGVDYMTNNLPYARHWDNVDGTVDAAFARIQRNIKDVIRGL